MAKPAKKKDSKLRAATYNKPFTFKGSFDDMITISLTGAGANKWVSIKDKLPLVNQKIFVKNLGTSDLIDTYLFQSYQPEKRPKVSVLLIGESMEGKSTILIDDNIEWKPAI